MPIQIISPTIGRIPYPDHDRQGRSPPWFLGTLFQFHPGLPRCPTALFIIATPAGRHDIFPRFLSASRNRHDMVERELFRAKPLATILTTVAITREDVNS